MSTRHADTDHSRPSQAPAMASRLLSLRARNGVVPCSSTLKKNYRRCRSQESVRWIHEMQENRTFFSTAKTSQFARHFSTFPAEVKATGLSDGEGHSEIQNVGFSSGNVSSSEPHPVENQSLNVSGHPGTQSSNELNLIEHEESSLGLLLGVDRSLLQYLSDAHELEKMVSVIESCSRLSSDEVESWVHPLMLATSRLESVDGAVMTERLLAKCLDLVGKQERTTPAQYMNLPYPSAEMYNMAISAWTKARTKHCAKRATQILELMSQEYRRGLEWVREFNTDGEEEVRVRSPRPDIINYTTVMNAWGKSGAKRGILQARAMLEELEQLSGVAQLLSDNDDNRIEQPLAYLTPDQACYNAVITGWARSSDHEAASRIEWLLQRMDTLHERTGDSRFQPDKQSFQMLITAYAKSAQQRREKQGNRASLQAAFCAENVLRAMSQRYEMARRQVPLASDGRGDHFEDEVIGKPDVMAYNAVINAFANSATLDGAKRAESILLGMLGESRNLDDFPFTEGVLPNTITFNTAINAWAKSGDADAGNRAERLLDIMVSRELRPETITFNALMNAWSRSKALDAAERVESILNYMLDEGSDARPNVISFSTAIFACGRSEQDDGALRAELLLEQMEKLYEESGNDSLRPTEACYDGVILAWLYRSGNKNQYDGSYAAERAESILKRMKDVGGLAPGLKQYNRVLNAWFKHESDGLEDGPNEVDRASSLLHQISSNATEGSRSSSARPDVFAYNYVIAACASSVQSAERRREAFDTALDAYNRLCESKNCSPNNHTYRMMFDVCVNLLPRSSDAQTKLMEKLFRECCNDGLLSNDILRTVRTYLPPSSMQQLLGADVVNGKKPIHVGNLPKEWSCSFAKKRLSG